MRHARIVSTVCILLHLFPVLAAQEEPSRSREAEEIADWIPIGSVTPAVVGNAVEAKARFQSRSIPLQRAAIDLIRDDIEEYGVAPLRIAAVPVLVDLLSMDYRILDFPSDYRVDPMLRISALDLLSEIGGERAYEQLRESVVSDDDEAVRVAAAQFLSSRTGDDPDSDLDAISHALYGAVRRRSQSEVVRLIEAADRVRRRAWTPGHPLLIESLITVVQGPYSASVRNRAITLLEELAER